MKFRVNREHLGDKMYYEGDEREADPSHVKFLIGSMVLSPIQDGTDGTDGADGADESVVKIKNKAIKPQKTKG